MLSNTVSIACSAQQLRQHPTPRLVIKPTTAPSPHNIACATLVSPDAYATQAVLVLLIVRVTGRI